MQDDIFAKIREAIVSLDEVKLDQLTGEIVAKKVNALEAIEKAYAVGIQEVGAMFERGDYFLPELVQAAEMVKASVARLQKLIPKGQGISKGKVVIGTVQGDIHDIGKHLVATMLSTRGIEVIDIGVDCPVAKFIDRAVEEKADIIGASTLLTMTAPEQVKLIESLQERGMRERFKVIVGGAAVDRTWAEKIGADGFGADLNEAVNVVLSLLDEKDKAR